MATDRYGKARRPGDRNLKIALAVFLVLLVSGVTWIGLKQANPDVSADIPSFRITSDHSVEAQIEVHKKKNKAAVCTFRSRDFDGNEVGRKELTFPAGKSSVTVTETLETTGKPNTAELQDCHSV